MLVVALDTSTPVLTAGVLEVNLASDGGAGGAPTLLAERTSTDAFAHAEQLMPLLRAALTEAGRTLTDAGAVVVGLGPGPFTGLRVGIASAAALGDALSIPVHGVPSHLAFGAGLAGTVLVATDARRREVYLTVLHDGIAVAGPVPIAPADVAGYLAEHRLRPTGLTGAGSTLLAALGIPVLPPALPTSVGLVTGADLGAAPEPLVPLYLRRPDAIEPTRRKSVLGR